MAGAAGISDEDTALLALYDDAATVASAALKLLPLDPAVTARWLADLAPEMARAAHAHRRGRRPAARARRGRDRAQRTHPPRAEGAPLCQLNVPCGSGSADPSGPARSSLIAALCGALADEIKLGVVTNDIYTTEDAEFLRATGVLPEERITAVQTGGCPHTAIRDDISANLEAVEELEAATGPLDLVFVESGGDNLTAIFSPALADVQIFVIDVAGGDDIPRKGGPGIARADLLVINKTDLAPYVGVRRREDGPRGVRTARRRCRSPRRRCAPTARTRSRTGCATSSPTFRAHGHLHSSMEGVPDHHHDHVH